MDDKGHCIWNIPSLRNKHVVFLLTVCRIIIHTSLPVVSEKTNNIWVEPARKGKGQKFGNITLYVLGFLGHLYIFCFAGNCHVFEAYRGESYYGI